MVSLEISVIKEKISVKKVITGVTITLARDDLSGLVSNVSPKATSNVTDRLGIKEEEKELSEQERHLLYLFSVNV